MSNIENKLAQLEKRIAASEIKNGVGYLVSRNAGGTVLNIKAGSASPWSLEFALYDASTTIEGTTTLKVGVTFGCVTCYALNTGVSPFPDNYSSTSSPPYKFEFEATASGFVWLKATNDISGTIYKVNNLTIEYGTTIPTPTTSTGYLYLGTYTVSTDEIPKLKIIDGSKGIGNQFYNFCGNNHFFGPL